MDVIGGILLFVAGLIVGAGTLALHNREVRREVKKVEDRKNAEITKLRTAYARLQEDAGMLQQTSDCADAYRRGKNAGRAEPMTQAERFAKTFEGKNVKFVDTSRREKT